MKGWVIVLGQRTPAHSDYPAWLTGGVVRDPDLRLPTWVQVENSRYGKQWVNVAALVPTDNDARTFLAAVRIDPKTMEDGRWP